MNFDLQALAMGLPQDIAGCIQAGEWQEAQDMIAFRQRLSLPHMYAERLRLAALFLNELRQCYTLSEAALLAELKACIPDFAKEDLRQLQLEGWLDFKRADGERRYFEDTVVSLIKANPDIARRAGRPLSPDRPLLDEAMRQMKREGSLRLDLRLSTTMRISDSAFQPGQTYRVHLPVPTPAPQQAEVLIEDVQPKPTHIARESAPQRSAFFELVLHENAPFTAVSRYSQWLHYCDGTHEAARLLYPQARPPSREDLEESLPHIAFTPYLKALCKELIGDEILPLYQARRFYDYITGQVLYSYVQPYRLIENGAEYAALNLRGDCGLQALLFITLCRIAGIPARWQSGLYAAPGDEGSHDWCWFYTQGWGWLPVDCSFGGAARRGGNEERRAFYFGNLDPYRAVFNQAYMGAFQPPRLHLRLDPYDNQRGEIETPERSLEASEFSTRHDVSVIG